MSRIVDEPEEYFSRLVPPRGEGLLVLEREAAAEGIPIIGPVVGNFLEILVRATGSRRVLELGTATGYSAIFLARGLSGEGGTVFTVERNPLMAKRAVRNIAANGLGGKVRVLEGDAVRILEGIDQEMDLIFLDVEKEAYAEVLPGCRRLLRPGGLLVADNTAFPGATSFLQALSDDAAWTAAHLFSFLPGHSPEHDGLTIAPRRP